MTTADSEPVRESEKSILNGILHLTQCETNSQLTPVKMSHLKSRYKLMFLLWFIIINIILYYYYYYYYAPT